MKARLPWDESNVWALDWADDFDDDDEQEKPVARPVPAAPPGDELLTIPQILDLGVSRWKVDRAIKAGVFPSAARRVVRPGRGGTCWTICRSEIEHWLKRLCDEAEEK